MRAHASASVVRQAQASVCTRLGFNLYGRLDAVREHAEAGNDGIARAELKQLLRLIPAKPRETSPAPVAASVAVLHFKCPVCGEEWERDRALGNRSTCPECSAPEVQPAYIK